MNDAPSQINQECDPETANPDVSGFYSQACKAEERKPQLNRADRGSLSEAVKALR